MDEGNLENQQPTGPLLAYLAPQQPEPSRNEPSTEPLLAQPAPQKPEPGENKPPTEPLSSLRETDENYDSELELSREADRLAMVFEMTEEKWAEWKSAQCRSRYEVPFTRRKIQRLSGRRSKIQAPSGPRRHMCFTYWQTEVRKPDELVRIQTINQMNAARKDDNLPPLDAAGLEELWRAVCRDSGLPELTRKEITKRWNECSVRGLMEVKRMFMTDVEAEVAATVVCLLYEDFAKSVRDESYGRHRTKIRFPGCRWLMDYVIAQKGSPDITDNKAVRDFACNCSNEFKRIADDTKLRGAECPEELRPVVDEYIHNAMRYTKPYPLNNLPREKLFYKYGKKRKDTSWLELECFCHVEKRSKVIKWAVPREACLCEGLNFRLTYTGDPLLE